MQQLQDLSAVAFDARLICSEIAFKATNLYNWDSLATLNALKNRNLLPGRNSKVQLFRGSLDVIPDSLNSQVCVVNNALDK